MTLARAVSAPVTVITARSVGVWPERRLSA